MFAAGILFAAPSVELSIYSTCKRISQKLLRNVNKFFDIMVNHNMATEGFKVIRQNMEEIVLQGPNGVSDVRIVNSYPSKVSLFLCMLVLLCLFGPATFWVQIPLQTCDCLTFCLEYIRHIMQ